MSIVIDTDIFVDFFRSYSPCKAWFIGIDWKEVYFSAITEAELIAGKDCAEPRKKEFTLHFLHRWEKIQVTNPIAVLGGDLSREYGLSIPDALIGATALISTQNFSPKTQSIFRLFQNYTYERRIDFSSSFLSAMSRESLKAVLLPF